MVGLLSIANPHTPPPSTWIPGIRPFASTSLVNTPLPANSILVPCNWPTATGSNYFVAYKWFLDTPAPSAPIIAVTVNATSWGVNAGVYNWPMTLGFTNTGDNDGEAVTVIGNACTTWNELTRPFPANDPTKAICNVTAPPADLVSDSGFASSVFHGAGVTAIGSSGPLGALMKEEFALGEINHMIGLCGNFSLVNGGYLPLFYPPAVSADGAAGNGIVQEGQVMAIPKTTSMPAGLSVYGQKIFRAMQNYGVIVFDEGGASQFYLGFNYNNLSGSWVNADAPAYPGTGLITDANILFPLCQKVGPAFDGIYGVIVFVEACAPQLLSTRYTGQIMNVTRDSDSTGIDIGQLGAPAYLLDTPTLTTFCSGTTGRVNKYYSQTNFYTTANSIANSGPFHFTSAGANAPIIYQSGAFNTINSKPALAFDGSTNYLKATGSSVQYPNSGAVGMFLNAVVQVSDRAANYGIFGSASANGLELRIDATTGLVRLLKNGGATIALSATPVALNAPTVISARYNADGSFEISLNGVVDVTGTAALVAVTAGDLQIGAGGPAGTELFKGLIGSFMFCAQSNIGTSIKFGIEQYQRQFWGTA